MIYTSHKIIEDDFQDHLGRFHPRKVLEVTLGTEDFSYAMDHCKTWSSEKDGDDYGLGDFIMGADGIYRDRKTLVGNFGELAASHWMRIPVDFSRKEYGDGGYDFTHPETGQTVDMKTSFYKTHGPSVTKYRYGKLLPLADMFIFGYLGENNINHPVKIIIVGVESKKNIEKSSEVPSKYPDTVNYNLYYYRTFPVVKD